MALSDKCCLYHLTFDDGKLWWPFLYHIYPCEKNTAGEEILLMRIQFRYFRWQNLSAKLNS